MPDRPAPLIRVATLAPFLAQVAAAGQDLDPLLRRAGLSSALIDDPDALATAPPIYRFAEIAAAALSDPRLGLRIGLSQDLSRWPPTQDALAESRLLVEFLTRFLLGVRQFASSVNYTLEIGEANTWLRQDRGFVPREPPAQIDGMAVGFIINLFGLALGPNWTRSGVVFQISKPEAARGPEVGAAALVQGGPSGFAVSFPSQWLTLPISPTTRVDQPKTGAAPGPPRDLAAALRAAIRAHLQDPELGMERVAAELGMRPRTLRKELATQKLTLRKLVDGERHARALQLLEANGLGVAEIAQTVGYTDPANFARAFRRWEGVSPSAYRRNAS